MSDKYELPKALLALLWLPVAWAEVVAAWNTRAPSSLELRLREYVKECREADPDDEGDAMRQLCADRIESLMEGKP